MPVIQVHLHPNGLHPIEAIKAWHMHENEGLSLDEIIGGGEVLNLQGEVVGKKVLWSAIKRVKNMGRGQLLPTTSYHKCGRTDILTDHQQKDIVAFVKKWRSKRFCTCRYIKRELKLKVSPKTIARVLNNNGFYWRRVPRIHGLSKEHIAERKVFVEKYASRSAAWWGENMNMVLDGVTLTMPPKPLSKREKHAAQRINSMWMRNGERLDNDLHTFNRYGIQLGTKVPLWGGFSGNGEFTLRLWTDKPKMTGDEWKQRIPMVKEAIQDAYGQAAPERPKVWHDNERFLLQTKGYKDNGMQLIRFPPNNGDLNPIENVWAWLRKDLAEREHKDMDAKRYLTPQQFKQRAAQILPIYAEVKPGEAHSRLQKLIRGMPARLRRCKANGYGRSGK